MENGFHGRTLATLSDLYRQQAETRLNLLPAVLTPFLLALLAVVIGLVIVALFAPLISLIAAVSSPG